MIHKLLYNFYIFTYLIAKNGSTYLRACVSMIDPLELNFIIISRRSIDIIRNEPSPKRYTRTNTPPDWQFHVYS